MTHQIIDRACYKFIRFRRGILRMSEVSKIHKKLGIRLSKLLSYYIIMLVNKRERKPLWHKLLALLSRYNASAKYGLKFSESSSISDVFADGVYTLYDEFIPAKDDIVVDIGAQYGDYSVLCSKYYGAKVYTFEPLLNNFKEIKKNARLNGIGQNRLKVYNVAIGSKNYSGYINYIGDMANKFHKNSKKIKTAFRTLDSFKLNPTILKIDVEGFELEVLAGAIRTISKYRPKIIIETHSASLEYKTKTRLDRLGYILKHEEIQKRNTNSAFDKVTNLFFSAV